jgi:hypothetical protein
MKTAPNPKKRSSESPNPLVDDFEEKSKILPSRSPSVEAYIRAGYAEMEELRAEAKKIIADKAKRHKRNRYRGRPTEYTHAVANSICQLIEQGYSLRGIVAFDPHVPSRATVHRWLREHPEFRDQYAHAQERRADAYFEMALEVSYSEPDVQRARLIVDTLKWAAGRLSPKRYGRQVLIEGDAPQFSAVSLMLKQIVSKPHVLAEIAAGEVSVERLIHEFQRFGLSGPEPNQNKNKPTSTQTTSVLRRDACIEMGNGQTPTHEK